MSIETSRLKCFGFDEECDDVINDSTFHEFELFSPVSKSNSLPSNVVLTPVLGSPQGQGRPHRFNLTLNRSNLVKNVSCVISSRKSALVEVNSNALPFAEISHANSANTEKSEFTRIKETPKDGDEISSKNALFSVEEDLIESTDKLVESKENLAENKIDQKLATKEEKKAKNSCQIQPTILSFFNREKQVKSRKNTRR